VWISYANFEFTATDHTSLKEQLSACRRIFERAYTTLKKLETTNSTSTKDERVVLLESWLEFEKVNNNGDEEAVKKVQERMPKTVKRRKQVDGDDGVTIMEEYFDYIFPDDEAERPNFKLLAMAHKWKMGSSAALNNDNDDSEGESVEESEESGDEGLNIETDMEMEENVRKRSRPDDVSDVLESKDSSDGSEPQNNSHGYSKKSKS
ncbi:hypothetical protein HK096_001893, partial [Nowakowskiella sp. JEL0078]